MIDRSNPQSLLVILGPTASGKTSVAFPVAKELVGEIISADARQIYKFMDIGTAKPSKDQMESVCHHFVDEKLPDQDFNAGEFGKRGRRIVEEIFQRGKVPIVVGGSGLYVQALIDGFFDGPPADSSVRELLTKRLEQEGAEVLWKELHRIDPDAAAKMLPSNTRRIIRALEVHSITGVRISELQKTLIPEKLDAMMVGLNWERKLLYKRIEQRVDSMIAEGLIDEARDLLRRGYSPQLNSLQTVGYVEVFEYLSGDISYERMIELIKQNSRRYAKRQMTWFRREKRINWFDVQDESALPGVARKIVDRFKETYQ
jgi:tRNA dimethylallyltransferase